MLSFISFSHHMIYSGFARVIISAGVGSFECQTKSAWLFAMAEHFLISYIIFGVVFGRRFVPLNSVRLTYCPTRLERCVRNVNSRNQCDKYISKTMERAEHSYISNIYICLCCVDVRGHCSCKRMCFALR